MEEESGIGGKMVRTKRETAKASHRKPGAEGVDDTAWMSNQADRGQAQERANEAAQFAETANLADENNLNTLNGLNGPGGHAPEANRIGFSQALAWNEEPEWQGELNEAEAETAIGSREPEG